MERWEEESKPFTNEISTNGQTNGDIFDNADAGHADDEDNGHEIPVKENHFENKMTDENNQKFRENEKILRKAAKKGKITIQTVTYMKLTINPCNHTIFFFIKNCFSSEEEERSSSTKIKR